MAKPELQAYLDASVAQSGLVTRDNHDKTRLVYSPGGVGSGISYLYAEDDGTYQWWFEMVPKALKPYVKYYKGEIFFAKKPPRTRGEYELENGSAKGVLELSREDGVAMYCLNVTFATTDEAALELLRRLRVGDILPKVSYEQEQTGTPTREQQLLATLEMYRRNAIEERRSRYYPYCNNPYTV